LRIAPPSGQAAPCAKEGFLRELFGAAAVAAVPPGHVEERPLPAAHDSLERAHISRQHAIHVGSVEVGLFRADRCRGLGRNIHGSMPWDRLREESVAFYSWALAVACVPGPWDDARMKDCVPLSTLLSQSLVAFTIELDNEADHRLNHKTTKGGGNPRDVWMTSVNMYPHCMRWLPEEGVPDLELERRARTRTSLDAMRRWSYIPLVPPATSQGGKRPGKRDVVLRPTANGKAAKAVWEPLFKVV